METNNIATTVDLYFEAWNSEGVDNIKAILEKCIKADCEYKTQTGIFYGIDAIAAVIENNNIEVPGRKFRLCSNIEVHNDVARYNWQLIPLNGEGLIGTDVFEFDAQTKMSKIIGFFPELIAI